MASIFFRTLLIYLLLSISIKLMGKRQIGELEVSELITTLLISEIASLPIADSDIPLLNAAISILFLVSIEIIVSSIKNKSEKLKRCIDGEPSFLIYKGKLVQKTLRENRISINELLSEVRLNGIGDISEVYYAVLEQNGKVSIIDTSSGGNLAHTLVVDGEINESGLSALKKDKKWLDEVIKKKKTKLENVFLLTLDDSDTINIIKKEEK